MNVLLISTYDLGHQPFGLASPAAWLEEAGAEVTCLDLAVERINEDAVKAAGLIAFHIPMHTATRLAMEMVPKIKAINPPAHLCFYGLYAPLNEAVLRELGADIILGGEYEDGLVTAYNRLLANGGTSQIEPLISTAKQTFRIPLRNNLPKLNQYAHLSMGNGETRIAGYTEASRGCKHFCRHCPVVPVYEGKFRIVAEDIVMADVRAQVEAGAQHITLGDPDFFNGPGHALPLIEKFHAEFPNVTYDATIKVEHLLKFSSHMETLVRTGCLFVTTAVESVNDEILEHLKKGHTRAEFIRVTKLARDAGLVLSPTFVPFLPWTTLDGYVDLLSLLAELDLIGYVAPVQLSIRLLIPQGSHMLKVDGMEEFITGHDSGALSYQWRHPDPRMDQLHKDVTALVEDHQTRDAPRSETFEGLWQLANKAAGQTAPALTLGTADTNLVPQMSEPWYCCAEPTSAQLAGL
ncbi:MAG: radical SAM protein [Rhodospirillaceae bacterium]|nr:radical SAM protein [Rhodospirillaceae bacterium]